MGMTFSSCSSKDLKECGICGECDDLVIVPGPARVSLLLQHDHFVYKNTRVCADHIRNKHLVEGVEVTKKLHKRVVVSDSDMGQLWRDASVLLREATSHKWINVEVLSNADAKALTGWDNSVLDDMQTHLKGMHNSHWRSIREALVMFWIRIRCDWPYQMLARSFRYNNPEKDGANRVSDAVKAVLEKLSGSFCDENIGARHWSYEDAVKEQTTFAKVLFAEGHDMEKIINLVWDATYTYHFKSRFYKMSRQLFSVPKHLSLTKHMSVQFPTGKSFDTYGPFFANGKNNDAAMTEKILGFEKELGAEAEEAKKMDKVDRVAQQHKETPEEVTEEEDLPEDQSHDEEHLLEPDELKKDPEWQRLRTWILGAIEEGYKVVFVVDRGFRNVIPYLESLGIVVKMPDFMKKASKKERKGGEKSEKQLPVSKANHSRLVTKVRWVVEAHHGRLKKWWFFFNRQPNSYIVLEHKMLRVLSAALNRYACDLATDKDDDEEIACEMLDLAKETNHVQDRVVTGSDYAQRKKKGFVPMSISSKGEH
eukprot:Lithocolla_globosa_v1_NODE_1502_length_2528_cov_32.357461.p1 type:complete len:537 gc:universal NODE_1502_length_2528_cov_32.357461:2152-542(-)